MTPLRSDTSGPMVLVLLFLLLVAGCSSGPEAVVGPWRSEPVLKKRVTVVPVIDRAGVGPEQAERVTEQIVELLAESEDLVIYPCPLEVAALSSPEKRSAMVEKAAELGFNALVVVVLNPHEVEVKKKGIWPFRRAVSSVHVSLVVDLLETTTGTLLLTHTQREEVELQEARLEDLEQEAISQMAWEKALPQILEEPTEKVVEALEKQPWIGRIVSVNERIVINGGSDIGITPLSTFQVFAAEELVTARDGRTYPISWKNVGLIRVEEVEATTARAVPLKGDLFLPGQFVVLSD